MKRLLAALLTISMMVSIAPFRAFAESPGTFDAPSPASAQEEDHSTTLDEATAQAIASDPLLRGNPYPAESASSQATVDTSNISMEATDDFGQLLLKNIDEQNAASSSNNRIIDVTVSGSTAAVEYVAEEDADIVVALYADSTADCMVASGTVGISATPENVNGSVASVPLTGSIPNSFLVKVFLLDRAEHAPLCNEYTSSAYTKELQDLDNATIDDYPADRVVNLDNQTNTNFAVVNEEVTLVNAEEASSDSMTITENGDNSCIILNADEKTKNLQPGDIFVFQNDDSIFALRIESVDVNGDAVTLTGDDSLELIDIFDVVKIESYDDGSQLEYDGTGVDSDVQYLGASEPDDSLNETNALWGDGDDGELSGSVAQKFTIGTKDEDKDPDGTTHIESKFGLSAVLNLKLESKFKYYFSDGLDTYSYSLKSEITGSVEVTSCRSIQIDLGYFKKTLPGIYIDYTPKFVFKGDLKGEITFKLTNKQGFSCDHRVITDTSEQPVQEVSAKISGTVYLGIDFAPSVKVGLYKTFKPHTEENFRSLCEIEIALSIGFEGTISSNIQPPNEKVEADRIVSQYHGNSIHECNVCLAGDIYAKVSLTVKISVIKVWDTSVTLLDYRTHILTLYYSKDYNDFGTGTCPHNLYLVNISVDTAYPPSSAEVFATNKKGESYSIGTLNDSANNYCYMEPGNYLLKTTIHEDKFIGSITVDNSSTEVTLKPDTGASNFGTCGDNLMWGIENETLTISGIGPMKNYDGDNNKSPWSCRSDITKIIIQNGITSIGDYAFYWCFGLSDVSIPDSVTSIGAYAFSGCSSLGNITLPDSVTKLGKGAFYISALCGITLSKRLTRIDDEVFGGCDKLTTVNIPSWVTSIGSLAFSGCENLTTVILPQSVTKIGNAAFLGCSKLNNITIPDKVTTLEENLFNGCSSLTNVVLPGDLTSLGRSVFYNCSNLTHIAIPDSVTSIGGYSFNGSGLVNVVLPNNLNSIEFGTFENCIQLESITIPRSVTKIGYGAFSMCVRLKDVFYSGSPEEWNSIQIDGDNSTLKNAAKHYSSASTLSEENSIFPSAAVGDDHSFAAAFDGLTPAVSYAIIVSKSDTDPLNANNLIYINQVRADSSSYQQSFRTKYNSSITANDMNYVIATGRYAFADDPVPSGGGDSSSGGGGGGAILLGIGAVALVTAGVILTMPVDVQGRAELADHTALPGAKISLLQDGNVVVQTTADENGNFALKAKRGSYELTVVYTDASGQLVHKTTSIKAPAKDLVITF